MISEEQIQNLVTLSDNLYYEQLKVLLDCDSADDLLAIYKLVATYHTAIENRLVTRINTKKEELELEISFKMESKENEYGH